MIYVSVIVYMCTNERSVLIHFIAIVLCVLWCCCCCSLTHKHTLNSLLLYRSDICIMCDF